MSIELVIENGKRIDKLKELARIVAHTIDNCEDKRTLASLVKQYRELIEEIELLTGDYCDDEISAILNRRIAEGRTSNVRPNRFSHPTRYGVNSQDDSSAEP